jgi:N-ethylmaleimide reductase
MHPTLFSPCTIGAWSLPNRIVMAPMTRCRATAEHLPNSLMAEYYGQRAGAGLLITEGTAPDPNGCGYARIPGIYSPEQIQAWKPVTEAVHRAGGRIVMQLMHTGRASHPLNLPAGAEVLSASATRLSGEMYTDQQGPQPYPVARDMTATEVEQAIEGFVQAARNARAAGFDGVELHGANGYLIDQFLTPVTNRRTDIWGGGIQGRGRFALEAAGRCALAIGADRVGIRLSPFGVFNDIQPWDGIEHDLTWLCRELGRLGLAYLHLVDHSSMGAPAVPAEFKQTLRKAFEGPLILSGGYDGAGAEADLAAGLGEAVAFGRAFLANGDLVDRLRKGAALNAPDFGTFYTPGSEGYTDYPLLA